MIKIGDKLFYRLERGLDVDYIPATVTGIGPKRIVIIDDVYKLRRAVKPENLVKKVPK